MSERKATDILIEIETKVDLILEYIKNIDFNLKLQSARVPIISSKSQDPVPVKPVTHENTEIKFVNVDEPPVSDGRKVTVHQSVYYPNGKPAVLAKIKIMDASKQLVKETKTNNLGKWNAVLDPGNYFIHITKAETADKPKIDHYFETNIPSSKTPFELESKK